MSDRGNMEPYTTSYAQCLVLHTNYNGPAKIDLEMSQNSVATPWHSRSFDASTKLLYCCFVAVPVLL